jgi:uncharacterized protein (DUF433 family)
VGTVRKSLRVPEDVEIEIQEQAEISGRDFSTVANELLAEAVRMRRCPGIVFADGPAGRRACVAGTGVDVWEVIATYQGLEGDVQRLRRAYHWLTDSQVRAALGYYAAYPQEIDRVIERNAGWTPARLAERHPALAADRR